MISELSVLNGSDGLNKSVDNAQFSRMDRVHDVGALFASFSIVMNGLLLINIFVNRNNQVLIRGNEILSLIVTHFVTGIVVISVYGARHAVSGRPEKVLYLVEEAIFYVSKCVAVNHFLFMCINRMKSSDSEKDKDGRFVSFQIQSLMIWITTLSWLVIPFILLNNGCSTIWFTACVALQQGPMLIYQFLAFMFGFPLVAANALFLLYLILSIRLNFARKHTESRIRKQKQGRVINRCTKNIPHIHVKKDSVTEKLVRDTAFDSNVAEVCIHHNKASRDTLDQDLDPADGDSCIVHCSSFSKNEVGKEEIRDSRTVLTTGLMLISLDISALPVVVSFLMLFFKTTATLQEGFLVLLFCNLITYPFIFVLTIPRLRTSMKTMFLLCLTSKFARTPTLTKGSQEVRLIRRFKKSSSCYSTSPCSCCTQDCERRRRANTADSVLGLVLKGKVTNYEESRSEAISKQIQLQSNSSGDVCGCGNGHTRGSSPENSGSKINHQSRDTIGSLPSVLSEGVSIEMDSQMSVSDLLSCQV